MSGSHDTLVRMANQIARNMAVQGEDTAVAATAEHIRAFWDPRMIAAIRSDVVGLDPIAKAAVAAL